MKMKDVRRYAVVAAEDQSGLEEKAGKEKANIENRAKVPKMTSTAEQHAIFGKHALALFSTVLGHLAFRELIQGRPLIG